MTNEPTPDDARHRPPIGPSEDVLRALCEVFGLEPTDERVVQVRALADQYAAERAAQDETGESHNS